MNGSSGGAIPPETAALFDHWRRLVTDHGLGSDRLGCTFGMLAVRADEPLLPQLLAAAGIDLPDFGGGGNTCATEDGGGALFGDEGEEGEEELVRRAEREWCRTLLLEDLEQETFAIDDHLRASLVSALADNAFSVVRRLAVLLEINGLVSLFAGGWARGDFAEFIENANKFLTDVCEHERFNVAALPHLGRIDLYADDYYPM